LRCARRVQLRRMWASEAAKLPILEFTLDKALSGLDLTMDQFIDTCILAGCDYCEPIKGADWERCGRTGQRSGI
jgi:flap endonuclease-1